MEHPRYFVLCFGRMLSLMNSTKLGCKEDVRNLTKRDDTPQRAALQHGGDAVLPAVTTTLALKASYS